MQFHTRYFKEINDALTPHFIFDEDGTTVDINTPILMSETSRNILLAYLWKIKGNRGFILYYYEDVAQKINKARTLINKELYSQRC